MRGAGPLSRRDAAVSDFVGTLLLVVVVVALGSVVAVLVASTLEEPAPPVGSFSLAPLAEGDAEARVLHRNGEPVPLPLLRVLLERDGAESEVPPSAWSTPREDEWRPGERLAVPLSPPAAPDELIRVRLLRADANALLADLAGRAPGAGPAEASPATLAATLSPPHLVPDGLSSTLLAVRVQHPHGALAAASLVADLGALSPGLRVPLNDLGREGDAVGGDGVWSAALRLPRGAPLGAHAVPLHLTDAAGRRVSDVFSLRVVASEKEAATTYLGVSFDVPTSENVTSFRVRNWTWDQLHPSRVRDDYVLFRVLGDEGRAWSCAILLDESGGVVFAKQMRVWGPQGETVYAPRNGTRLPLAGLDMDLMDPVASEQWAYGSGAPHPTALYAASGIQGSPRFAAVHFGHDMTTANQQLSLSTGIFSADLVVR